MKGGSEKTVAHEIATLRKLADELVKGLSALAQRVSEINRANEDVTIVPPDALNGSLSLSKRIVLLLDANAEQEFTPVGVQAAIPDANMNSIRSALIRLDENRRIQRPERGWYASAKQR